MQRSKKWVKEFVIFLIVGIMLIMLSYLKVINTGYSIVSQDKVYVKELNLNFSESSNYSLDIRESNFNKLKSVKVSGSIIGSGRVRVFFRADNDYLILDSSNFEQKEPIITGYSISNESLSDESEETIDEVNDTQEEVILEDVNISDEGSFNELLIEDNESNLSQELFLEEIDLDESNITSNESIDFNITEEINETVIEGQVVIEEEEVILPEGTTSFKNVCVETCSFSIDNSDYSLIIEIDNANLLIDTIEFTVESNITNNPPGFLEIPEQYLEINGSSSLNLSNYTYDFDGDVLTFDSFGPEHINVSINVDIAKLVAEKDFVGEESLWFKASDGINTTYSNTVRVYVGNLTLSNITNQSIIEDNLSFNITSVERVDGNYVIKFRTTGTYDLEIAKVNNIDINPFWILDSLSLKCGDSDLLITRLNESYLYENYNCSNTSLVTFKVPGYGKYNLNFTFGSLSQETSVIGLLDGEVLCNIYFENLTLLNYQLYLDYKSEYIENNYCTDRGNIELNVINSGPVCYKIDKIECRLYPYSKMDSITNSIWYNLEYCFDQSRILEGVKLNYKCENEF